MTNKRIFLVANSHIDPVWLWDKYEGIDEVINTFRSACDRLDEYPDLRFSASSTCFYEWVERYAPEVFERIKAHVGAGRWEITGGWWVESDCNLPSAESFRKSAEISKAYISDRFGVDVPVAYSPDAFGHAASLPKILAETGFDYYVFCRPDEREKPDLPGNLFYWEHAGKRVLCYRLRYHYTMGLEWDTALVDQALRDEDFVKDGLACYFFGLGDHGGGPTKAEIEYLTSKKSEISDRCLAFSTCLEFFKEAEKLPNIPTYSGDLHCHAVGCYSVNRGLKQAVRDAENALCYTERVLNAAGGRRTENLDPLWKKTIFNQFHDIMPGSCSPDAARQALTELGAVEDACSWTSYEELRGMSAADPARCPQGEFRIFNSLHKPVTRPFEIESFMYFRPGAPFKDSSGRVIPVQEITSSVNCVNRRWLFVDTIPGQTMKSYYFDSNDAPPTRQDASLSYIAGNDVATAGFKVSSPGAIVDVRSGTALFKRALSLGVVEDQTDTWSHGIKGYGPTQDHFEEISSAVCKGPLASFLISRQRYGSSTAELLFSAYEDLPYVDLDIKVIWNEKRSVLKLEIEPLRDFDSILVQGPGAAIEKQTRDAEEPLLDWILAGELGIVQHGAFAFDRCGDALRVTLVRSSLYGYDRHWKIDQLGPVEHTDIGEHRFKLRFFRRQGLTGADMDGLAAAFKEPFQVIRSGGAD